MDHWQRGSPRIRIPMCIVKKKSAIAATSIFASFYRQYMSRRQGQDSSFGSILTCHRNQNGLACIWQFFLYVAQPGREPTCNRR